MTPAEAMMIPTWMILAGGGLGLVIVAMLTKLLLINFRHCARLQALTAQLLKTGDTLERDAHETQEATRALKDQLNQAFNQLRKARDKANQADQANQAKSAFLAMMSHELRTPLSAIIGFSEMIEQQSMGPIGNTKYRDYATDIRQSGQHLLGIINDILDLSKVESGKEALKEQNFALDDLIAGVKVLLEGRHQEAGVELAFDLPDDLPGLRADKRRLTQILVNLLSNGIKFTPEGGTVRLSCWVTPDSGIVFQAVDSGVGMSQEDIPLALSVFGQVDNGSEHLAKGTGLGLPLSKALAELHGGSLDLQSEEGEGTTVTLRLPAHRIVARPAAKAPAAPQAAAG